MNILYIFGNGLDKAQGMATSYPEFYEFLQGVKGSPLLEELKKDINADKKLWSDMEEAFGLFTEKIKSESDFDQLYFELYDYLRAYLQSEDLNYSPSERNKKQFLDDFLSYNKYLNDYDRGNFELFRTSINDKDHSNMDVMTFNYTHTIETLLSSKLEPGTTTFLEGNPFSLGQIIHVHGELNNEIIVGVDNEKQIANEAFKDSEDIKDILIKNQSNSSMGYLRPRVCENFIAKANLIILFGVSLGATDSRWWKLIGEQFKNRADLCIIQYIFKPDASGQVRRQYAGRIKRKQIDQIMKKMNFNNKEEWPQNIDERLFFVVNSDAFKFRP